MTHSNDTELSCFVYEAIDKKVTSLVSEHCAARGESQKKGFVMTKLLTPKEFGTPLHIHAATVSRWAKQGLIKSVRLGASTRSPLRIPASELERAMTEGLGTEAAIVTERALQEEQK